MSYPRLHTGAWVVVADGERALFLANEGTTATPKLQVQFEMQQENPLTHEQGTSRPGRMNDATTGHKSAVEQTDFHRLAKERFAVEIAERLEAQAEKGSYDQVLVAAPPMILGELRKSFGPKSRERIIGEVDKNLTKHPPAEIAKILLGV